MRELILTRQGTDYWGRTVYLSQEGHYYKRYEKDDGDGQKWFPDGEPFYTSSPADDFDGEPGFPVDTNKVNIIVKEEEDE